MRRFFLAMACGALLASGAAAQDREQSLVGQVASEIRATDWLNTEALTLESLRGKVVVLYFWGVW